MNKDDNLQLTDKVELAISGERGTVTGIASYTEEAAGYRVHYKDAHGAAKTDWFTRGQLNKVAE
jgi:hypothetical protein